MGDIIVLFVGDEKAAAQFKNHWPSLASMDVGCFFVCVVVGKT